MNLGSDEPNGSLVDLKRPLIRVIDTPVPRSLETVAVIGAPGPDIVTTIHQIGDEYGRVPAEIVAAITALVMRFSFVQVQRDLHGVSGRIVDQNSCIPAQR